MPIDTSPSNVATSALQAIPYGSLIGGPLDACIKAQSAAAMTTVDFIQRVAFTKDPVTGKEEVKNVTFQYVAGGETFNLVVPLLAIVPIPYIGIDQITIDFKANIHAESSSVTEDSTNTTFGGEANGGISVGLGPFSVKVDFKANYSSKKDSKATQSSKYSVEYTMDVHVEASQADMPAGLAKVLNILEANITSVSSRGSIEVRPTSLVFDADKKAAFEIRVLDAKGAGLPGATIVLKVTDGFEIDGTPTSAEPGVYSVTLKATKPVTARTAAFEVTLPNKDKRVVTVPVQPQLTA